MLPKLALDHLSRLLDGLRYCLRREHLSADRLNDRSVEVFHPGAVVVLADLFASRVVVGAAVIVDFFSLRSVAAGAVENCKALPAAGAAPHPREQIFLCGRSAPPFASVADIGRGNLLQPLLRTLPERGLNNPQVRAVGHRFAEGHLSGVALAVKNLADGARSPRAGAALAALRGCGSLAAEIALPHRLKVAPQGAAALVLGAALGSAAIQRLRNHRVAVTVRVGAEDAADRFGLLLIDPVVGMALDLLAIAADREDRHVVIAEAGTARIEALRRLPLKSIPGPLACLLALELGAEGYGAHHEFIDGGFEAKLLIRQVEKDAPALAVDAGKHAACLRLLAAEAR